MYNIKDIIYELYKHKKLLQLTTIMFFQHKPHYLFNMKKSFVNIQIHPSSGNLLKQLHQNYLDNSNNWQKCTCHFSFPSRVYILYQAWYIRGWWPYSRSFESSRSRKSLWPRRSRWSRESNLSRMTILSIITLAIGVRQILISCRFAYYFMHSLFLEEVFKTLHAYKCIATHTYICIGFVSRDNYKN